ncbi:hypothetical protein BU16DRAFT_544405 [Lophium mytilinum]|uniref:Uncharacterized protein n=1 Tax=Lophium mytilinum TaxID=390894 RepID=A0A6A6QD57_9PEZI|nr:hypothetical protein BU16DRAFT_544405 [Lophium mytilinum]
MHCMAVDSPSFESLLSQNLPAASSADHGVKWPFAVQAVPASLFESDVPMHIYGQLSSPRPIFVWAAQPPDSHCPPPEGNARKCEPLGCISTPTLDSHADAARYVLAARVLGTSRPGPAERRGGAAHVIASRGHHGRLQGDDDAEYGANQPRKPSAVRRIFPAFGNQEPAPVPCISLALQPLRRHPKSGKSSSRG